MSPELWSLSEGCYFYDPIPDRVMLVTPARTTICLVNALGNSQQEIKSLQERDRGLYKEMCEAIFAQRVEKGSVLTRDEAEDAIQSVYLARAMASSI